MNTDREPETDVEDAIINCWCGATGYYEDLFDEDLYDESCGGGGVLYCFCGGDLCVCHHHGETECPGCDDCDRNECGDDHDDYRYPDED